MAEEAGDVDSFEFVQNISSIVSNEFAWNYLFCHMAGYDVYVYYKSQRELYGEDAWLDWF